MASETHILSDETGREIVAMLGNLTRAVQASKYDGTFDPFGKTMGVRWAIAESDPAACERLDDAVGLSADDLGSWVEFFGCYPCLLKDGEEVGRLRWGDFSKFEDGAEADITSGEAGDVMIAFPRRDVSIVKDDTYVTVRMTSDIGQSGFTHYAHTRANKPVDVFYIGAYMGSVLDNKTRSLSGKEISVRANYSNMHSYASANGTGYYNFSYFHMMYLQCCFMLMYANRDSQSALGRGYVDAGANAPYLPTGTTNLNGACFGEQTGLQSVKFLGIEDLWGNFGNWIDCFYHYRSGSTNVYAVDSTTMLPNGDVSFAANSGVITDVFGTPEGGFLATSVDTNNDSQAYFSDYFAYGTGSSDMFIASYGGGKNDGSSAGIFRSYCGSYGNTNQYGGLRLMYLPAGQ